MAVPKSTIITFELVSLNPATAFTILSAPTCDGSGRSISIGNLSDGLGIAENGIESEFSRKRKQLEASLTTEAKITCFIRCSGMLRFFNFSSLN